MLIQEKIGRIGSFAIEGRVVDALRLEWYETGKRVMRKQSVGGREVALRFLNESPALMEGDLLYADGEVVIVVEIIPCEVMVIPMGSLAEVAAICYEIGNRHLPLFIEGDVLLAPLEQPLYRWLVGSGYEVSKEERKLLYPLRSTVAGHEHSGSLFSRILQITNPR